MLICQTCHDKRQSRKALECQPLQFTGYTCNSRSTCAECSHKPVKSSAFYEYLNAYSINQEWALAKETLESYKSIKFPNFPISLFYGAGDMLDCNYADFSLENIKMVMEYCSELEDILSNMIDGETIK